ncbi:Maf family nucleotide pyrophosphatase [Trichlorobacter ammonificans]|uniref:dTTP/UTP pyrophosphatase n=1 Tax=Trichlorobacter ammonificans TaxID=2916410 RepID=A0ABM9D504_9BACT|nr:Maf family nucleotide pyrophosphatase [Trichlorobacter ammonificans]CAH2030301.1 dTTP/UTP pyrophosphatase [Trichlorobacter ammonificans]
MGEIVLASASPRRSELLELAGVPFRVAPADIPEEPLPGEEAAAHAMRLAEEKARAAAAREASGRWFIGADTIVVLEGRIMGKPKDEAEAEAMLADLSGRSHQVITAYAVFDRSGGACVSRAVRTDVVFKQLDRREIEAYVATGCPLDKAGAYAIQGGAAHFVREIRGSYTNVVGLPTCELVETLRRMGALEQS